MTWRVSTVRAQWERGVEKKQVGRQAREKEVFLICTLAVNMLLWIHVITG